jgi:hypothetical protein
MTAELRKDLIQLSFPNFIDFFLRRPGFGGLDRACETLDILNDLTRVSRTFCSQLRSLNLMVCL